MKRSERHRRAAWAILLACLLFPSAYAFGDDRAAGLAAAGWEESTPGRWYNLPERKVQALDNGISGEFVLAPGTGVAWGKKRGWELSAGAILSLEMSSDGTNPSSKDYMEFGRHFPVSVTVVFGKDSMDLPFKTRLADFFVRIWRGFPPGGIRLTYAFGNRAPVGSMYRPGDDEETVFILAGEEEKGKKVQAKRELRKDFRAAYGRDPKGPVTRIIVRAERPSGENGPIKGWIILALPGP
ncbi:MAG: DUF3047 domain-containing protein [Deltaproteobacteria bacterium]|nr:DUF3047 domain-containing protein [Deltaproteobacteria bacterium]